MNEGMNYKKILNTKNIKLIPLKIKFDITRLDMIISFLYKPSVLRTRKTLANIYKLFQNLDDELINGNPDLMARVWIINTTLRGRLEEGFENDENLMQFCFDQVDCDEFKRKTLTEILENKKISYDESKYIVRTIDDTLEFGYVVTIKEIVQEIINQIDDGEYKTYKEVSDDLYTIGNAIINIKRKTASLGSDQTFSLDTDEFDEVIEDSLQKLKDRNKIFITGIQRLNTLLSPGYLSKRLYTYLAFPGKGKSTILLKSALDIKRYNGGIQTKDPEKRPAVLMLTLENDIPETIERIYNMAVDGDDIRNYTAKQIKRKFRKKGQLELTKENNIDIIIKEYKNRELDTNDLYTIINDLEDDGVEVIALIVDYIKRIRPAERADSEKAELKNISNELKELAKYFDIPVITAQQLNRSGAAVVDAALQAKKEDVTRLVGRDSIAGAWEIIENSDFCCIINPEVKSDTGELFLTFKLLKRRYRSSEENESLRRLEYFNQPFEPGNEIRLLDDIDLPKPLALESLSTQFEAVDNKRGKTNAVEREHIINRGEEVEKKSKKKKDFNEELSENPFDMNNHIYN